MTWSQPTLQLAAQCCKWSLLLKHSLLEGTVLRRSDNWQLGMAIASQTVQSHLRGDGWLFQASIFHFTPLRIHLHPHHSHHFPPRTTHASLHGIPLDFSSLSSSWTKATNSANQGGRCFYPMDWEMLSEQIHVCIPDVPPENRACLHMCFEWPCSHEIVDLRWGCLCKYGIIQYLYRAQSSFGVFIKWDASAHSTRISDASYPYRHSSHNPKKAGGLVIKLKQRSSAKSLTSYRSRHVCKCSSWVMTYIYIYVWHIYIYIIPSHMLQTWRHCVSIVNVNYR